MVTKFMAQFSMFWSESDRSQKCEEDWTKGLTSAEKQSLIESCHLVRETRTIHRHGFPFQDFPLSGALMNKITISIIITYYHLVHYHASFCLCLIWCMFVDSLWDEWSARQRTEIDCKYKRERGRNLLYTRRCIQYSTEPESICCDVSGTKFHLAVLVSLYNFSE